MLTLFIWFPAPVPGDVRPEAGRHSLPYRRVLLQVRRPHTLRPRYMAHICGAGRHSTLPSDPTPSLPRT